MANTLEVGKKLVALCKEGKTHEAVETLYDKDIVSVEAMDMPNMPREQKGIGACFAKEKWWNENNTVHGGTVEGPFPNGDKFAVRFTYDITSKQNNQRTKMDEVAIYTVGKNGKIVREEFFYGQ